MSRLPAAFLVLASLVSAPTPAHASPYAQGQWSVRLVDEAGHTLPTFRQGGRTYVLGFVGRRYAIVVRNDSYRRIEAVVSVDGRDVVDGRPASTARRGYLVDPYSELTVDGFRVSDESVAAFRFASVPRSYAARMGNARDVGVIGVAIFPEAEPPPIAMRPLPHRWPETDRGAGSWGAPDQGREDSSAAPSPAPSDSRSAAEAPSAGAMRSRPSEERAGLGTEFGEERESAVTHVEFQRASSSPSAVMTLRYDDQAGLAALGIDLRGPADETWMRANARAFGDYAEPPPGWARP